MAHLEIGEDKKYSFELAANFQYTIGRGADADWRLKDEPFLSRLHAQVSLEENRLKVKRLPSASNPIFHSGVQSDEFFLEHGELFVIGALRFKFIADKTAATDAPAGPLPETEHLMAADEVYAVSDRLRLKDLLELPEILRSSKDPADFYFHVAAVLRLATGAQWAAVVSREGTVCRIVGRDCVRDDINIAPSSKLIARAVEVSPRPVFYSWRRPEPGLQATISDDADWAVCAAADVHDGNKLVFYVAGSGGSVSAADSAGRDNMRYVGLVADMAARSFTARRLEEWRTRLAKEQAGSEALFTLSAQVAHDIRSPLAALDSVIKDVEQLPGETRLVVQGAIGRIREIADDLIDRNRQLKAEGGTAPAGPAPGAAPQLLASLIEPLIAEKRLEFRSRAGIKIEARLGPDSHGLSANVRPVEFKRMLSNLVNNAAEALGDKGAIIVSITLENDVIKLKIEDNAKGIPPEILKKLGQKGETHGKEGGSGLGLYYSRTMVESWGGNLGIESAAGKGTVVTLTLPRAPLLALAEAQIRIAGKESLAVLIDDDALVRMSWKLAARKNGVNLHAFAVPGEFLAEKHNFGRTVPIYIDSELGEGVKGETIAETLRAEGFTDLTLETGHPPEKFSSPDWLKIAGKEPPFGQV